MTTTLQLPRSAGVMLATAIIIMVTLSPLLVTITFASSTAPRALEDISRSSRVSSVAADTPSLSQEWNFTTGGSIEGSPAIADIDGDAQQEILVTSHDDYLYCVNESGMMDWRVYVDNVGYATPSIVDIDSDSQLEIVIGSYSNTPAVYCFNSSGGIEWTSPNIGRVYYSPTVADIDGDLLLEVIVGSNNDHIVCLNNTGGVKWSYPTGWDVVAAACVADLDNDGLMEVVIGSGDNVLYCLNCTGDLLWSFTTGNVVTSAPLIADVNADGALEVILGAWDSNLYCFNATGGVLWAYDAAGPIRGCTAADIDQDNDIEILFGVLGSTFYCVNGSGKQEWNCTIGDCHCAPSITDVDGDGRLEVVIAASVYTPDPESYANFTYVISENGAFEWIYDMDDFMMTSSPAIVDVDGDGQLEIMVGCSDGKLYCLSVPGAPFETGAYPWPGLGFHGSVRSTGDYSDSDLDGLADSYEATVGTDLDNGDTDADGRSDYDEFLVSSNPFIDSVAPAGIMDLVVEDVDVDSVTLSWTAPGNNGETGNATGYVVRYSTTGPITAAEWDSATTFSQTWTPAESGDEESHVISDLDSSTTYWFALIAYDAVPNYGPVSNSPNRTTLAPATTATTSATTSTTPLPTGDPSLLIVAVGIAGVVVIVVLVYMAKKRR